MTAWWLIEANPRQYEHLERLYAGQLANTAPRRHCPHFPDCAAPCRRCFESRRNFHKWIAMQ